MVLEHAEGGKIKIFRGSFSAADGTNICVYPVSDKIIRVLGYDIQMQADGPVTVYFVNSDGTTQISRSWLFTTKGDAVVRESAIGRYLFQSSRDKGVNLHLSGVVQIEISGSYLEVP